MTALDIALAHDSPAEQHVQALLEEALLKYDLRPWLFTSRVMIDQHNQTNQALLRDGAPEIHLKVGFRSIYGLLTMFIHEQLHIHLVQHPEQVEAAVLELQSLYPEVPVGGSEGARSERSTYEHLLLCTLEREAVTALLGADIATRLKPVGYQFIYGEVERNGPMLRALIDRHGLAL